MLVRTSNPGSAALQELEIVGGGQLWERVAALVGRLGEPDAGPLSSIGAVVGATQGHVVGRARELMPRTPFLLPGIGAQGGELAALAPAFAPGPGGGLVAASRSVLYADPGPRWQAGGRRGGGAPAARVLDARRRLVSRTDGPSTPRLPTASTGTAAGATSGRRSGRSWRPSPWRPAPS